MTTHSYFNISLKKLLKLEGTYANDPDDKGGETYCGISRNNFPNWSGWFFIDKVQKSSNVNEILKADLNLLSCIRDFYFVNFWTKMYCDKFPQSIASELFELSVNVGIDKATTILQLTLNILNNNQKKYLDIETDGKFGKITLETLQSALVVLSNKLILNVINILQGSFYIDLMQKNPVYEKYIGWFNRIAIIK